jgi:hypothetical protein
MYKVRFKGELKKTLGKKSFIKRNIYTYRLYTYTYIPGDQEGLFKLAIQLRKFFNWVIYNTATGYVLLVHLTNI